MRLALLLSITPLVAANLSISPDPIFECSNGLGVASVAWSGVSGPAEVRVGDPKGPSLTGLTGSSGNTTTGTWVRDGMAFFLVNQAGSIEASAVARLRCGGTISGGDLGLTSGSFFPLQIGNTWIYRVNSRAVTSAYLTQTIHRTEELGGQTYYVLSSEGAADVRFRGDSQERIWRFTGTATAPGEELYLDPAALSHAPFQNPLGNFPDSVAQRAGDALLRQDRTFVRGLGLAQSVSTMLSGSSGGFSSGLYLVEARLDGIRVAVPAIQLSLSIESRALDVTGKKVTNCAIPSYCVACGLIGADPPGTYKPCAQARVEGNASTTYTLELDLVNAAGEVVFRGPQAGGEPGAWLRYLQLRLYSAPNTPLPPGSYSLITRLKSGNDVLATSTLSVQLF